MSQGKKRLLIVDDDAGLRDEMRRYLSDYEFAVQSARDGPEMDRAIDAGTVDLVILDLMLPGEDGLSICRRLLDEGGPAVIIVSAAGAEVDRVLGLELGADDYLPKPFSPRELLARARAVLRRRDGPKNSGRSLEFVFNGFSYNTATRELRSPDGIMILLTAAESSLLGTLLVNAPRVLPRADLWIPGQFDPESRALDLVVSRLRRKLQVYGGDHLIRTHRGEGYRIDCPVSRP
jgi:two-component system OmpR family response regulator